MVRPIVVLSSALLVASGFAAAGAGKLVPLRSGSADPVIAAAGDIACDPSSSSFDNGAGTATACAQLATSDLLVGQPLAAVLALGDEQYGCGGYSAFVQSYAPSWGRVKSVTHPVPGNHEYQVSGGTGCDVSGAAQGYFSYFGAAAGSAGRGYYSFDLGAWHLIALNSNCANIGGCGKGSAEESWLRADLKAHPTQCTLAFWHHPRFTSGVVGDDSSVSSFWQDLYNAGADVVLNGHAHGYERFAAQTPAEIADAKRGIREFVVGTGGEDFHLFTTSAPLSETREDTAFGVLFLTLHPGSYDWRFTSTSGAYGDSGTTSCH